MSRTKLTSNANKLFRSFDSAPPVFDFGTEASMNSEKSITSSVPKATDVTLYAKPKVADFAFCFTTPQPQATFGAPSLETDIQEVLPCAFKQPSSNISVNDSENNNVRQSDKENTRVKRPRVEDDIQETMSHLNNIRQHREEINKTIANIEKMKTESDNKSVDESLDLALKDLQMKLRTINGFILQNIGTVTCQKLNVGQRR